MIPPVSSFCTLSPARSTRRDCGIISRALLDTLSLVMPFIISEEEAIMLCVLTPPTAMFALAVSILPADGILHLPSHHASKGLAFARGQFFFVLFLSISILSV